MKLHGIWTCKNLFRCTCSHGKRSVGEDLIQVPRVGAREAWEVNWSKITNLHLQIIICLSVYMYLPNPQIHLLSLEGYRWIHALPTVNEMQTASSRIWTRLPILYPVTMIVMLSAPPSIYQVRTNVMSDFRSYIIIKKTNFANRNI